jgi:hypothetical protein
MAYYEIVVEKHINQKRLKDFMGMEFKYLPEGQTLITGQLQDQAELFSVINKIRDLNIIIVSINKRTTEVQG